MVSVCVVTTHNMNRSLLRSRVLSSRDAWICMQKTWLLRPHNHVMEWWLMNDIVTYCDIYAILISGPSLRRMWLGLTMQGGHVWVGSVKSSRHGWIGDRRPLTTSDQLGSDPAMQRDMTLPACYDRSRFTHSQRRTRSWTKLIKTIQSIRPTDYSVVTCEMKTKTITSSTSLYRLYVHRLLTCTAFVCNCIVCVYKLFMLLRWWWWWRWRLSVLCQYTCLSTLHTHMHNLGRSGQTVYVSFEPYWFLFLVLILFVIFQFLSQYGRLSPVSVSYTHLTLPTILRV